MTKDGFGVELVTICIYRLNGVQHWMEFTQIGHLLQGLGDLKARQCQ